MASPSFQFSEPRAGLKVSAELRELSNQPGYLSVEKGGQRMRNLYANGSIGFNPTHLSEFGLACYAGHYDRVKQMVQSGIAPDICGYETEYRFGYLTLTVAGSQRIERVIGGSSATMKHTDVAIYLLSCGADPDLPDIACYSALQHSAIVKPVVAMTRILLEGGANVNHRNKYGATALLEAMQNACIACIEVLFEFGADAGLADADGVSPDLFYLQAGPEVTATFMKWKRIRSGEKAGTMETKQCDGCGKSPSSDTKLLLCSRCHTARYCNPSCQKKHWPDHKSKCTAFKESNTLTLIPHYEEFGNMMPTAAFTRSMLGVTSNPIPGRNRQNPNRYPAKREFPKSLVVKVQVPFAGYHATPHVQAQTKGPCLVYTKKRDLCCQIRRDENGAKYDLLVQKIRSQGVAGLKAYFPAEMKSKEELTIKIGDILAEQPF